MFFFRSVQTRKLTRRNLVQTLWFVGTGLSDIPRTYYIFRVSHEKEFESSQVRRIFTCFGMKKTNAKCMSTNCTCHIIQRKMKIMTHVSICGFCVKIIFFLFISETLTASGLSWLTVDFMKPV